MRAIILDTETGGLDPKKHSLLTIGMIAIEINNDRISIVKKIGLRCAHKTYNYQKKALEVNKIDISEHDTKALEKARVIEEFTKFIVENNLRNATLIGQNIQFDISFLKEYLLSDFIFHHSKVVDTISIWNFLKHKNIVPEYLDNKLGTMASYYNIDYSQAHNALEDCLITMQVYQKMLEERK